MRKEKSGKPKRRLRVGVIFGGRSAEHEVSLVSASSIINSLDKEKYEIIPVGITPQGKWFSDRNILCYLQDKCFNKIKFHTVLPPDPTVGGILIWDGSSKIFKKIKLDVVFPVLHGTFGEDGTVQGLMELADLPYVGADVLASAIGMDKVVTKQLCEQNGIPVVPYVWFYSREYRKNAGTIKSFIEKKLKYPLFIKPANSGSSVGITKVHNRKELHPAILIAGRYDTKILVEESVENAREIEVSVLGNEFPRSSIPGEIISSNEFYDYDAKYVDGLSKTIIPAQLSESLIKKIQKYSLEAFKCTGCSGMARVDFLVSRSKGRLYFNEINTIPGFTMISMYPKLWEATGLSFSQLLDELIKLAIEKHKEKSRLCRNFKPKQDWYR